MNLLQGVHFLVGTKTIARLSWFGVLLAMAMARVASAQVDNVLIYGTVKDLTSSKKLDNVSVTIYKNGAKLIDVPTNASGKYEVNLDYGADYKVMVSKSGFVGKNINIDTRNIPEEDRLGGHGMNIDFSMLTDLPGIDYSVLNEPFGKAAYTNGTFTWDIDYTNRMRDAQARLMKEYDEMRKREGDAEAKFAKLMDEGTKAMSASDFKKAVGNFTEALVLKPKDPIATAKLSDAKMRFDAEEALKKGAEQYNTVIKEADQLFSKKDYAGAKVKYNAAIDLNDKEPYPKQRIKEVDAILADLEKQAAAEKLAKELQEKYQAAITAGDAALKAQNWDQATVKYTEASGLKPEEKYPKDQLALVATKKAEAEKKAEEERLAKTLEANYKAAITAADAAFKSSKWDQATAKYTEASGLKPEEKYPKDQLLAITKKQEELAKKAEEEALAKALQEQYQAAITAADAAFRSANYDVAETKYTEASGLKPAEKYPKDQLAAIGKKREELAKKLEEEQKAKELDERYKASIASADAAFTAKDWDNATAKYTEASGMKPAEKYPKDQLAAIVAKKAEAERLAEEERKRKALDEAYNAAIVSADQAFGKENWEAATKSYQEASALKAQETYPKDQLAAITARIAADKARKEQEELDGKYQKAIEAADAAFGKKEYPAAKAKYQEASGLKSAERYPKDRIAEVDALVAEAARKAEEERKAAEFEARYSELIKTADKAFDGKRLSEALNDYKDALKLKPSEAHPKERISTIEQQLDAAAQAKAEEERLLREKQELDKRYNDLITAADKAYDAKDYQNARAPYTSATELKPKEQHPKDRLAAIDKALADAAQKAEQDSLAAAREAEERARKAEADRLAAEAAAAEKARLEAEERQRNMAAAELDAEYREFVAAGDIAFSVEDFDKAILKYNAALGVKPSEQYPKERIAAIEARRNEAASKRTESERLAAERERLEAERLAKEAADAEAARLAAEADRDQAEAERLRREKEAADARRAEEERLRLEREGDRAFEERYRALIISADEALAAKDYTAARGTYAQASDMQPEETYPLVKIDQIDKLLAEQERLRLEAEAAAKRAEQARADERPKQNSTGSGQEDEAVRFMREAREREEAEKYERIKKFRASLEQEEQDNASDAAVRREEGVERKERVMEESDQLYQGNDQRRTQRAEELLAFQEALERAEAERRQRASETRSSNYQDKLDLVEKANEQGQERSERQADRASESSTWRNSVENAEQDRALAGQQRSTMARDEIVASAERIEAIQERGSGAKERQQQAVEDQKRAHQARETAYARTSADSRAASQERLNNTPADQPRAFADYNRSKLAQEYPEGVTEESYTEGNKVIIRRVVVNGNKADEFSKVIAKWGTFYFKNGQSITEAIWRNGTEG
jgi:hypothetical protein